MGGDREYKKFGSPRVPGKEDPSRAVIALAYSVSSVVAFYPLHPVISVIALTGGIAFGTAAGIARLVQGGHFPRTYFGPAC